MRKTILVCVALLLCLILAGASSAADERRRLTVVFTEWFPYTYLEQGQPAGFEIEITKAVLKRLGHEAEFVQYPWNRCLESIKRGRADALVSLLKTPEREAFTFFPEEHVSVSRTVLFALADTDARYDGTMQSLLGRTIGVIRGFSYGPAFDQSDLFRRDEAEDALRLLEKLLRGRDDLAAENQAVLTALARRQGVLHRLRVLSPPLHTQKLYVGFSLQAGRRDLGAQFSQALSDFKLTPEYWGILKKYGVEDQ